LPAQPDGNPTIFEDVTPGQFSMSETLPDDQVFLNLLCSRTGEGNDYELIPLGPNGEYPSAYDDGTLYCDWFNYQTPAFLIVAKFNCPEGVDYANLAPAQLATQCNEPVDPPVTFNVTIGESQYSEPTDPNLFNTAFFPYLEPGEALIEEQNPPEGYELVRTVCADVDLVELVRSGQLRTSETQRQQRESLARMTGNLLFTEVPITGNGITWELLPFNLTGCAFFNAPIDDYTMTLYKWECPVGTLYNQTDPNYYSAECDTQHPGVKFTLTDGNGTREFTSDVDGVQVEDIVLDANGTFTITELGNPGFGDPMRYCQPLNPLQNGVGPYPWETLARGASITVNPYPGDDIQCFYYNIPYEYGDVTIYKYRCPDGAMPDWTYAAYSAECTSPMPDVTFSLAASVDGQGFQPQDTDANGMVRWEDVPGGPISITETVPPGYDPHPFVACRVTPLTQQPPILMAIGEDWTPVNSINGVINLALEYGVDLECHFFNRYLGDGEITVYKY